MPESLDSHVSLIGDLFRSRASTSSSESPLEVDIEELASVAHAHNFAVSLFRIAALHGETETIEECSRRLTEEDPDSLTLGGPCREGALVFLSEVAFKNLGMASFAEAQSAMAKVFLNNKTFAREWVTHQKNASLGIYRNFMSRIVYFGKNNQDKSSAWTIFNWPVILRDKSSGVRYWGMMRNARPASNEVLTTWGLRDLKVLNECGTAMTVIDEKTGFILWQNASHMALVGMHSASSYREGVISQPTEAGVNFLEMLFHGVPDILGKAVESAHKPGAVTVLNQVAPVTHPLLRRWMGLKDKDQMWISVRVSLARDPATSLPMYIISHVDVTDRVRNEESLKKALHDLEVEKRRTEALLSRQHELVDCLGKVTNAASGFNKDSAAGRMLESVKNKMMASVTMSMSNLSAEEVERKEDKLEILELVGRGSFGKVYKALWNGTLVAVKKMVLSPNGQERQERMAIMEAAISSSLAHPNIVQTYTYNLHTVKNSSDNSGDPLSGSQKELQSAFSQDLSTSSDKMISLEVQLVLEWCDFGTLRDALSQRIFFDSSFDLNYPAVLLTASDIAKGMLHLHKSGLVHSDLKARNVLLKSSGTDPRGFTAKVSDFGLSLNLDDDNTHIENLYQGTTTHMAPEVLLRGRQSKASDVYAFGIVLWELFTGGTPFAYITQDLLGLQVVKQDLRPEFLPHTPPAFVSLARDCWAAYPEARPDFEAVLESLQRMISETPCTRPCHPPALPMQKMKSTILVEEEELGSKQVTYEGRQAIRLMKAPSTRSPGSAFVCASIDEDSELKPNENNRINLAQQRNTYRKQPTQELIEDMGIVCKSVGSTIIGGPTFGPQDL